VDHTVEGLEEILHKINISFNINVQKKNHFKG